MNRDAGKKRKWLVKAVLGTAVLLAAFFGTKKLMGILPEKEKVPERIVEITPADTSAPAGINVFSETYSQPEENPQGPVIAGNTSSQFSGEIPHMESRYLLANLSEDLLTDFAELYRAASNFENFCYLPVPASREDTELLMTLLHTECPELFQNDSAQTYHMETVGDTVRSVTIPYCMGKMQYDGELAKCKDAVAEIASAADSYTDDYDRALAVYRELCSRCAYDQYGSRAGDAAGVLLEGKGKCDGISLAYKWVLDELGIPCIVVAGKSRKEGEDGHAWNIVKAGAAWGVVDATQDCDVKARSILCYPAFNTSDEILFADYSLQEGYEKLGVPECPTTETSYHVKNGSYIRDGEEKTGFFKAMSRAAAEGGMTAVQFETAEGWRKFEENSASWARDWMDVNSFYGSSSYLSIDAFRTAQISVSVNANSGRMREISDTLSVYEADIKATKQDLEDRKSSLNIKQGQIGEIQAEAEEILAAAPEEWSDEEYETYNFLAERHDELQEEYLKEAEEYNRQVEVYRELSAVYNELVQEYNALSGKM